MVIIDPEGLFGGDRLRCCSNAAQLHWPRLFLASNGFGRLEINYARIIGRAYSTFSPIPTETEIHDYLQEYEHNFLLFLYQANPQYWGQWDVPRDELLPRYKTAQDKRSPIPPEPAFSEWKRRYRNEFRGLPKSFGNISEKFPLVVVGVGVGVDVEKPICASTSDARVSDSLPLETTPRIKPSPELTAEQDRWFTTWWGELWLHKAKKPAREAFRKHVRTEERFQCVMAATRAQKPEMLNREASKRPHGATWLNGERWEDETESSSPSKPKYWKPDWEIKGAA